MKGILAALVLLAVPLMALGDTGLSFEATYEPFAWPALPIVDFAVANDGTLVVASGLQVSLHEGTLYSDLIPGSATVADPVSGGVFVGGTRYPFALDLFAPDASWQGGDRYEEDIGAAELLTLSPDGETLYGSSAVRDQIVVFSRVSGTAGFVPLEEQTGETCGVGSLSDIADLAVSPDGLNLYAASRGSDSIAVFEREPLHGGLRFVSAVTSANGLLADPESIAISPDGDRVYVAAGGSNSILVFQRDPFDGSLVPSQELVDGEDGVEGIAGVTSIALSPDGEALYAAGSQDDALAVFVRDEDLGGLRFREVHRDLLYGVRGLRGARLVRVSPDGGRVFVSGSEVFLAIFDVVELPPATPTITPGGPVESPTTTPTLLPTWTRTPTGTRPSTPSPTSASTPTRTQVPGEPTWTPTDTATATITATSTRTATETCLPMETSTPGPTSTPEPEPPSPTVPTPFPATPTSVATQTPAISPTAVPTESPSASLSTPTPKLDCPGDCDGNGQVGVSELIVGIHILLENGPPEACLAFDVDGDGTIGLNELVAGIAAALDGCAEP